MLYGFHLNPYYKRTHFSQKFDNNKILNGLYLPLVYTTLSDIGDSSNLISSLSRTMTLYSPP